MNCRKCRVELTAINTEKVSTKLGFRTICKSCRNKRLRDKRAQNGYAQFICNGCNNQFRKNGSQKYCSLKCKVDFYSYPQENGCIYWNSVMQPAPKASWQGKNFPLRGWIGLSHGIIASPQQIIDVTCKVKKCINPNHFCIRPKKSERLIKITRKLKESDLGELTAKYEKYNWSIADLARNYNVTETCIRGFIRRKYYKDIKLESDLEIEGYDTCNNCSKKHNNIGSLYCSNQCMNDWINK